MLVQNEKDRIRAVQRIRFLAGGLPGIRFLFGRSILRIEAPVRLRIFLLCFLPDLLRLFGFQIVFSAHGRYLTETSA